MTSVVIRTVAIDITISERNSIAVVNLAFFLILNLMKFLKLFVISIYV